MKYSWMVIKDGGIISRNETNSYGKLVEELHEILLEDIEVVIILKKGRNRE